MIDTYMEVVATTWWLIGYAITIGIMLGMHEADDNDSMFVRWLVALIIFVIAYFIYPVFLGMFITRFIKDE